MSLPSSSLPTLEDLHSKARLSNVIFPNKYIALDAKRAQAHSDGQISADGVPPAFIGTDLDRQLADRRLVQEMRQMLIDGGDPFECSR